MFASEVSDGGLCSQPWKNPETTEVSKLVIKATAGLKCLPVERVSLLNLVLLLTPLISCHFIMITHFVAQYKSV